MNYSKNALLMTLALSGVHVVVCKRADVHQQVKTSLPNTDVVPGFLKTNKERLLATDDDWYLEFESVEANFSVSSKEELVLKYNISSGAHYTHTLLQSDCNTSITDIGINTTAKKAVGGLTSFSLLTLSNSINKTKVANSSIWNTKSSQIELCQKVQLYLNETETKGKGNWTIVEDIHKINIGFDLSANFSVTGDLGPATINQAKSNTTVASYVDACQCSAESFDCLSKKALVPNEELHVCIYSESSEVLIEKLMSMIIKQQDSTNKFDVITGGNIKVPTITLRKDKSNVTAGGGNGVKISTRVPQNIIKFDTGNKIDISGDLVLKLAGSNTAGRRLVADEGATIAGNEETSFELEVSLQQQLDLQEDPVSSAASIAKKGSIVLGSMAFVLVYAMW